MLFLDIDYGELRDYSTLEDEEVQDRIIKFNGDIENYKIKEDTIIITYDNNEKVSIPYSKKAEIKILKKIRDQEYCKYEHESLTELKTDLKYARIKTIIDSIPTVCWGAAATLNLIVSKYLIGAIQGVNVIIWGPQASVNLIRWIKFSKKIKEVKKYKLYRSMEDDLSKLDNLNNSITIFKNKKKNELPINAYTYKKFKIKDLEKVKNTLEKINNDDFNDTNKQKRK